MPQSSTHSRAQVKGIIAVEVFDAATGQRIEEECSVNENLVTDVGLAELMRIVNGGELLTGVAWEICVGTSSTAPAAGDVALGASVYEATITNRAQSGASVTFKLFIDTTQGNGSTWVEAGLKHDNVLVDRALLSASVAKDSTKNVTVSITLTMERA